MLLAALCVLFFSQRFAFGAPQFVGASICAECHGPEYRKQSTTHHARALRPVLEGGIPAIFTARSIRERSGLEFEYRVTEHGLGVTARKDRREASALLEWAFGDGVFGFTLVGRAGERYFEHRISYYTAAGHPGITPGHPVETPRTASAALGSLQAPDTIYRCFNCHATGVLRGAAGPEISAIRPGVGCERCHGPGGAHVEAARAGRAAAAASILNPGRYAAKALVEICGECHRTPNPAMANLAPEEDDPMAVRYQPVGLMASRCFRESKKLSCLTCHDPHDDARRSNDAFYTEKCLSCHAAAAKPRSRCRRATKQNCLPCHMQRTSPAAELRFTDHRIRVY